MKISKLLNKKNFSITFIFLLGLSAYAEDKPIDIWKVDTAKTIQEGTSNDDNIEISQDELKNTATDIYKMQSQKNSNSIELDTNLNTQEIKIIGLYDPEDYGLDINMWSNSNGDQLKNIFNKINKINLSNDASELMQISLLTNAYLPQKNISEKEFLEFRSNWLIKNSDLNLIEEYLIKNQILDLSPKLTKYLIDEHLSEANIQEACRVFGKNSEPIDDEYLTKFNIYCLINEKKIDEAQLLYDLKKELGSINDTYFENKINFLIGYTSKSNEIISEKNILHFHLAHRVNPEFSFEPKNTTSKLIWRYLSSSNLLNSFQQTEISDLEKISTIEKAVHNKNYSEKDLFELYKRFQFSINQLLNAEQTYKSLSNIEARALIYQKILLQSEMIEKLKLLKTLKSLFIKDEISQAFDIELKRFLEKIDPKNIPDNLTSFYYTNFKIKQNPKDNIKFNNDILHQSKLVNYFNGDYSKSKIEKDVNNFLKKIRKNKKYSFSKRDQIFLESLKSDGIEISQKFDDLFKLDSSQIPTDIQVMINNDEKGAALLRIIEVIGQDKLERIDDDTIYFIISTLNQLDIDPLRNKILLKVLPLKV